MFQCSGGEVRGGNTNQEIGASVRPKGAEVCALGWEHDALGTVSKAEVNVVEMLDGGGGRAEGHCGVEL